MFEGFAEFDIATTTTSVHGRRGGDGPPVLLLHGIPETHLMWHRVAPRLAERFTVVATDLRGFGDSGTPPSSSDHAPYSMREIALDQVEIMRVARPRAFRLIAGAPDVFVNSLLDIVGTTRSHPRGTSGDVHREIQ